ncbi:type IV toxin-antitoxin system AbiEi family antitoxin domain-containing protein [Lachnospiraceae bacterium ZAX-1]
MLSNDEIKSIFQKHGNVMRTSELSASKIYYNDIQTLLKEGVIEKLKQGYYYFIDEYNTNEIDIIKRLYPDAILCMHTALFHYGYSDRTPSEWNLAVDKNISRYKIKIEYPFIKSYLFEPHLLDIGLTEQIIDNTYARIYDKDRTICDCLRYMGKMDKEIFNKAIQKYVNDSKKNIPNLIEYAKPLRVQKKVKDLIGVWL